MTALGPGLWADDDGALHIDLDAAIAGAGFEPNDENRRVLIEAARQLGIDVEVVE